ncbi:MAG: J domain-containing protein [Cyanothece sp. SIO1E1]|nr:J domain-containing protein [Cyanothece sp. SIO1E1]
MLESNHYTTLEVSQAATQAEIKQAYRRLAKVFHPDSKRETANHEQIARINAAYEILGDPQQRQVYDQQLDSEVQMAAAGFSTRGAQGDRQQRTAAAQSHYQRQRQSERDEDAHFQQWMKQVYRPVNRFLTKILSPLREQLKLLSADPFDDDLMADFQAYIEECRAFLEKAQKAFQSMPNPSQVAGVAAHLYYCLNQVGDGIDELERFTFNYNEQYLHTGQELFRIATGLRREAQAAMKQVS